MKKKAVILAAGVGSRLEPYSKNTPKCLIDLHGTNALKHILYCLSECDIEETVIVVGYKAEQIQEAMGNSMFGMKLTYVYNKHYSYHGCEYSLALSGQELDDADSIVVTEGDLLMPLEYYKAITSNPAENAVAVRAVEINPQRSVVAVGRNNKVEEFVYDREHIDVFRFIKDKNLVIGESMQLWKFGGKGAKKFVELLDQFSSNISEEPDLRNGLISINLAIKDYPMEPVIIDGDSWINLNTAEDVEKGRSEKWLKR